MTCIYSGRRLRHLPQSSKLARERRVMRIPTYCNPNTVILFQVGDQAMCKFSDSLPVLLLLNTIESLKRAANFSFLAAEYR